MIPCIEISQWDPHISALCWAAQPLPDHPAISPGHQEVSRLQGGLETEVSLVTAPASQHLAQPRQTNCGASRPPTPVMTRHQPGLPPTPVTHVLHLRSGQVRSGLSVLSHTPPGVSCQRGMLRRRSSSSGPA